MGALLSEEIYQQQLRQTTANVAAENLRNAEAYKVQVAQWHVNRRVERDNHLPATPVPLPAPLAKVVIVQIQVNPWPAYDWPSIAYGPELVAPIAEDDPEPAPLPQGVVSVGVWLYGKFWRCMPNDTAPAGTIVEANSVHPRLRKVSYPFGSWYEEV
jgi:hypothetical protein